MPKLLKIIIAISGLLIIWAATLYSRRSHIEQDLIAHAEEALREPEFSQVAVSFMGRDGTLTGEVDTPDDSEEAERRVKRYWGVRVIDNKLKTSMEEMTMTVEEASEWAIQDFENFLLSNPIEFEYASSRLSDVTKRILDQIADLIERIPESEIEIEGHTDNVGSDAFNMRLSEERAVSVRDYLIENGMDPGLLLVQGFGESAPIAGNDTEEGRQRNRRVHIRFKSSAFHS